MDRSISNDCLSLKCRNNNEARHNIYENRYIITEEAVIDSQHTNTIFRLSYIISLEQYQQLYAIIIRRLLSLFKSRIRAQHHVVSTAHAASINHLLSSYRKSVPTFIHLLAVLIGLSEQRFYRSSIKHNCRLFPFTTTNLFEPNFCPPSLRLLFTNSKVQGRSRKPNFNFQN